MELYIHLPFCKVKCRYCDFVSFPDQEPFMERYVQLLLREAEARRKEVGEPLHTLYVGGGTPSLLPPALIRTLFNGLRSVFSFEEIREFTLEANPGTLSMPWLNAVRESGANRLSMGMQTSQEHLLKTLGRIHTMAQVRESVRMAREAGFRNLNLDLIFGIPGQTVSDWSEALEEALCLAPEHLSCYGLIPEEGTPLMRDLESGALTLPDEADEREMYDLTLRLLDAHGYEHYEISNFAKPGCACAHNIGYWRQTPYLGLGVAAASMNAWMTGASSCSDAQYFRRTNPDTLEAYEACVLGQLLPNIEPISPADSRFETLMLSLRMMEGVSEAHFEFLHGVSLDSCYGEKLRSLASRGLLTYENAAWRLTRRGMDIQNAILVELMND